MKTLVIGDLHGQYEIAQKAVDTGMPLVFVGDYLDSFYRSVEDQIRTLRVAMDAMVTGQAIAIAGNHEISYMKANKRCGGYNPITQRYVNHINMETLYDWHRVEGFLISHAGVSDRHLQSVNLTLDDYLYNGQEYYDSAGITRGGRHAVGGLRWCHYPSEFEPVKGVSQIFGHTRQRYGLIAEKDNNWCIDVLEDGEAKVLEIENGKAKVKYL